MDSSIEGRVFDDAGRPAFEIIESIPTVAAKEEVAGDGELGQVVDDAGRPAFELIESIPTAAAAAEEE